MKAVVRRDDSSWLFFGGAMDITKNMLNLALGGGTWVLWLLILLSVISVVIMVERALTFYRSRFQDEQFIKELLPCLEKADWPSARALCESSRAPEPQILLAGLNQVSHGKESAAEAMEAERLKVNQQLNKGLNFLGTLGANAPFIGLFGTVLGIIHAFKDLALAEGGGGPAVMAGIAEALVATAVGLLVAIPAVVMYNFFHGRLHNILERSQRLGRLLLAILSSTDQSKAPVVELQKIGGRR
jgi:biopolymer transport protein ExbB